jgi:AraC-like DNA-binding protein
MKLFIKNMVSTAAKANAISILRSHNIHAELAELGEVELGEEISADKFDQVKEALKREGFDIVNSKASIIVEKTRNLVIEMIHYSTELPETNYSDYISSRLHLDYTYLSRCFTRMRKMTIQQFIIAEKIERVKELLLFNDLSLSEIAWRLHYSSASHLSAQFKKVTGVTPSDFRRMQSRLQENGAHTDA